MSKINLLTQVLNPSEAIDKLNYAQDKFMYAPLEGGYVSSDAAVIVIVSRQPYDGMVLQYNINATQEQLDYWKKYLSALFNIKEENKLNNEVIQAINRHLETMTEEEQIMILKYIHALKDFREVS